MSQPQYLARAVVTGLFALAAATAATTAFSQSDKVNAAISEQTKTEEAAAASQKRISALDDEADSAAQEYRQLLAEVESLKTYNEQLGAQVKAQEDELSTASKQISNIESTSREVLPMIANMLATLDQFVQLDVPFLPDERKDRVAGLKDMMNSPDVTLQEKYRRVLEAYGTEMDFGRTIEEYEGKVESKTVDFLRVGRIALLYQTLDGSETGYWDIDGKKWVVDNGYRDSVKRGLKIAKKQAAQDLLVVPIAAAKGAQ